METNSELIELARRAHKQLQVIVNFYSEYDDEPNGAEGFILGSVLQRVQMAMEFLDEIDPTGRERTNASRDVLAPLPKAGGSDGAIKWNRFDADDESTWPDEYEYIWVVVDGEDREPFVDFQRFSVSLPNTYWWTHWSKVNMPKLPKGVE